MIASRLLAAKKQEAFTAARVGHWDAVAAGERPPLGRAYQRRLREVYRFVVPEGARVLELGCATGGLLAALNPSRGVGVDFSPAMIGKAREKRSGLEFVVADAHDVQLGESFDYVIMSDLLNDVWDVQRIFANLRSMTNARTRLIINTYSKLWQPVFSCFQALGLATPVLQQNWLTVEDTANLLYLEGLELVKRFTDVLFPMDVPILAPLANRWLSKVAPFRWLCVTNVMVARRPTPPWEEREPRVSVVVPVRNEEGNIEEIFDRTPEMGGGTELVFVESDSSDDSYAAIQRGIDARPGVNAKLYKEPTKGKGKAVRLGFAKATGDVFMILDADLTVPPEDLPRFYDALVKGTGECVNGVRLVYPMENQAMRFLNLLGNKFFSQAFTWMLGQPIKDTLCGTKVMSRESYEQVAANRAWFGDFDPYGDFDLLFGAAKLNLKIVDLPIRYGERTYGTTNINRLHGGALLFRMVLFAARRIRFF